jgi:hypothetical protein
VYLVWQKWKYHVWERGAYHARQISRHGVSHISTTLRRKLESAKIRRLQLEAMRAGNRLPGDKEARGIRLRQAEFVGQIQRAYKGKPYAGNAVLIRRRPDALMGFDPGATNGWETVIRGHLQMEEVGCKHNEFFEKPHVDKVVSWLDGYLSKAGANLLTGDKATAAPQLPTVRAVGP